MKPIVVKIGGSTLGSNDTTLEDLVALQKRGVVPVVVHGGGNKVTEWLEKQGGSPKFVDGLRVTDRETLDVVIAVLCGLVNKELVAAINSLDGKAIGLSGIDGHFIEGKIKDPQLGQVGEVVRVNLEPLEVVLQAGYIPVIAPLGLQPRGVFLNINSDTAASEIAVALKADRLIFLTDVVGICDASGRLLPSLPLAEAGSLVASGTISGGMIPKVEACLRALSTVSIAQIIDGREQHALMAALEGKNIGTTIKND